MELLYKPDWTQTKENYKAWWDHQYFGRCAMWVTAPKTGVKLNPTPVPAKNEDKWLDLDYITANNLYTWQTTFYGGEAFPDWNPGYPGIFSHNTMLGCELIFMESTAWKSPIIADGDLTSHDYKGIKLDKNCKWWKFGREVRERGVRECRGKAIPGNLAFGGCGDTLAAIRSTEKLLLDLTECPDYVREFDLHLMKQWIEIFEESYSITHEGAQGSKCFFNIWSPGKMYASQNDFAYMISKEMFTEIFLPSLEMQTNYLDHTIHHVDGEGNFKHVDALLSLKRLQALQILPGAGKPSPLHYMDILKKVQKTGRNLHISIPPDEVEKALDLLSARGLFISTHCKSEEEARDLLKYAEHWSVDRG